MSGFADISADASTGGWTVPAAVRAVEVTKRYGVGAAAVIALDNVTAALPAGRFTAVMGPSGSGKSTLLHCLAGLETVDRGRVYLGDTELSALSERALTRLRRDRVGFVFQSFNLMPTLTAAENVLLPLRIAGRRPDRSWIDQVVDAVGLRGRLRHRPAELSGGEQQRLAVARALAGRPAVVFADEPTGNLDSHASADLLELLRRCVDELGQTVVMVTHDPSAAAHADRALFVADGRVVDEMAEPTTERVLGRAQEQGAHQRREQRGQGAAPWSG
jgi:putative ABC transport system ATP-binding protein